MSRFLIAASALTVTTLVQGANWVPTSPLVQIGNDCDLFFDASTYLEVTDNLYSGATKTSATQWLVTPGLSLEYGKDSALSVEFKASRSLVHFNGSQFAGLEDDRDALSLGVTYADGGPLKLSLNSSYRVTARNDDLQMQGVSGSVIGATLVHHSGSIAEVRAYSEKSIGVPETTPDGFSQKLKSSIEAEIPESWLKTLDPLTEPSRLVLAKLITDQADSPLKPVINPQTGQPIPRAVIVSDPELQNLAREGNYGTLLRHPLLTKALADPQVKKLLTDLSL